MILFIFNESGYNVSHKSWCIIIIIIIVVVIITMENNFNVLYSRSDFWTLCNRQWLILADNDELAWQWHARYIPLGKLISLSIWNMDVQLFVQNSVKYLHARRIVGCTSHVRSCFLLWIYFYVTTLHNLLLFKGAWFAVPWPSIGYINQLCQLQRLVNNLFCMRLAN